MEASYELYPFHEDESIAVALGTLLVQRDTVSSASFDKIATKSGVNPSRLRSVVVHLGLEDVIERVVEDVPELSSQENISPRSVPSVFEGRAPIVIESDGIRDPDLKEHVSETQEVSFQTWILIESSRTALASVTQIVEDALGRDTEGVKVTVQAEPSTVPYPERFLWIAAQYLIDGSDPGDPPAVRNPPSFPFAKLVEVVPLTVNASVEHDGERFDIRNIPVTPYKIPVQLH